MHISKPAAFSFELRISPRKTERLLWGVALFFILTHTLGTYAREVHGHDRVFGLVPLFSLREGSLQTWFATLTLAGCAALLAPIGVRTRAADGPHVAHWLWLAGIFLFLSADEAAQLHEHTVAPLGGALALPGALKYSAWVIPYAVLLAVFAAAYLPFLRRIDPLVCRLFITAGVLYVGGAAGMELLSAPLQSSGILPQSIAELLQEVLEELGEMGGVAVFVRALLTQLAGGDRALSIRVGGGAAMPPVGAPSRAEV